jgi:hypothetical protein
MKEIITHSLFRLALIGIALVIALAISGGAQAQYGNPYGNDSNSVRLYSSGGKYLGNLNDNRYDSNSVSNPYGRYGSQYSSDSINNPYGYGSPYGSSLFDEEY